MDLVLIVLTVGALALAAGLSIVGWKLLQQDRAELDARVESLRTLAAAPDPLSAVEDVLDDLMPVPSVLPVAAAMPITASSRPMHAMSVAMPSLAGEPARDWDSRLGAPLHDAGEDADADLHLHARLLGGAPAMSPASRRGLVRAGVAVVMLATAGTA